MKTIVVIDAQGGGIGKQIITEICKRNLDVEIIAVGTNSAAATAMKKAGAHYAATGENPVVVNARRADYIMGPIGIAVADSMFGEITPAMAVAIGQSDAVKVLIPINSCGTFIAGVEEKGLKGYIDDAIDRISE